MKIRIIFPLLLIILAIGVFSFFSYQSKNPENSKFQNSMPFQDSDEPPLKLKSIGVNLDYYDPKTNKAGDFVFTKQKLQFNRLFMGFGFVIPANSTSSGKDKSNPQPTFILPLGTPVRSLVDGVVASMPILWSGDISIQVTADGSPRSRLDSAKRVAGEAGKIQKWIYETEHVRNPKVKVGDRVTAGQVIAEVGNFGNNAPPGFGAVEIGILKGGQKPEHVCPFLFLDESIKSETLKKLTALFKSWEDYIGDLSLYDETTAIPGCLTLDPIEG